MGHKTKNNIYIYIVYNYYIYTLDRMEISQLWLWPPVINMSEELLNICNAFIVILHLKECIDPPHSRGATYTGGQTK